MTIRESLAGPALTGNVTPRAVNPPGAIPVPGFDASYVWQATAGGAPLTAAVLGGAVTVTYPSGGVLAVPDGPSGTVVLSAWWAYASGFTVTRVAPDGTRTPVRDADSWPVTGDATRRNLATHPANRVGDLVGWTAGTNTTLASLSGLTDVPDPGVTTGVRATATAAGSVNVTFSLDAPSTGLSTYGLWVKSGGAAPSSASITVQWYDVNGSAVGSPSAYPVAATAVSQTASGWSWCQATISGSPVGAVFGVAGFTAAGLAAGGVLNLTGRLWEAGTTLGSYFDGTDWGANWIGTPYKSASTLAPVQTIIDAEAPLDVALTYELTNPVAPGYTITSTPVSLDSSSYRPPRDALLTHPGLAKTVRVWIEAEPDITRPIEQTAFQVIGRPRKVVVSAPQRGGDEGSLTFVTESQDEWNLLLAMLDDGSPLLLRAPADYGHPPLWWLSFGDATLAAPASGTANNWPNEVRRITVPFTEVDRPSVATRPLVA